MSDDLEQIKKDVASIKKQINKIDKKLDLHIERIWAIYDHLQKPIETVKNLFGGNKK
jgi:archaellum component FlaC|tara:strand:- start:831 stop:1001 length:171 start_codon:yes stop_codon:yes gene_type:complete